MIAREPIAIVRMACVFPGALSSDAFWTNVAGGHDAIRDVPPERWDVSPDDILDPAPGNPDRAYSGRGGIVEGFRLDTRGIDLSRSLVEDLDPLFHWVLSVGRDLTAGLTLPRERTGVALANLALPSDLFARLGRVAWRELVRLSLGSDAHALPSPERRPHWLNHFQTALPAGLLARSLNLQGGTLALDAACASSLYAIKLACDQLQAGRVDTMIAGGVARTDRLCLAVGFSQLRALSRSGRARPFDRAADGLIPGEGCGLFLLKRLGDAVRARDEILAVIRGVGLSNDGRARGVLTPSSEGQIRAMRAIYAETGIDPRTVGLVECHATGTLVGDLAEVGSLKAVWGAGEPGATAIGSVKSMVGHLLTAAGSAGLMKAVHAVRHAILPPTLHFEQPQPGMAFEGSPFVVNTEARPWDPPAAGGPRRAGVSAFGFGGCNAHLILEAPPAAGSAVARTKVAATAPLAIVGMAARFGVAPSVTAYKELLFDGIAALVPAPASRWFGLERPGHGLPHLPGSYVTELTVDDPMALRVPPAEIDRMAGQQLLSMLVAEDLSRMPGLLDRIADRSRVGVVMGFAMEASSADYAFRCSALRDAAHATDGASREWLTAVTETATGPFVAESVLGYLANLMANRISSRFDFGGPSLALSAEDASALKCLEMAALALRRGEVDAMLVGGADLPADLRALWATDTTQGWSRDALRVFDRRADGSLPGEGAGLVMLKRLADAERDGDTIYAILEGVGSSSDGAEGAVGQPGAAAHALALRRALDDAGVTADRLGVISIHGSGRPAEDTAEIDALHRVAGAGGPEPRTALMATKPVLGHAGAASGMVSLIGAILALHHRAIPPFTGLVEPALPEAWTDSPFYAPRQTRPWLANSDEEPRRAGVSSMSIDGNHVHAILREGPRPASSTALGPPPEALFVFRGSSRAELVEQARALARSSAGGDVARMALERAAGHERGAAPLTLSIVATDLHDLGAKIDRAVAHLKSEAARIDDIHGIYFAQEPLHRGGRIAFVFPGAGASYPGMARELLARFPELLDGVARRSAAARARRMEHWVEPRRLTAARPDRHEQRTAQEMIGGGSFHAYVLADALRSRLGVAPDASLGYSLGESTGLFALGAWTAVDEMHERMATWPLFTTELAGPMNAVRRAWKQRGLDVEPIATGDFWSTYLVVASPEAVREATRDEPLAHLAIINTDAECILAGETRACARALARLRCSAHVTPFPAAVHVPEAAVVRDAYRAFHRLPTTPPDGVTYYSSATGEPYDVTVEGAAQAIVEQAVTCVDFPRLIANAYGDGVRIFVEVGPRGSCTRWITKILGGRDVVAVAADRKGRSDFVDLAHAAARLAAHGVPIDLRRFYGAQVQAPAVSSTPGQRSYAVARTLTLPPPPARPAVSVVPSMPPLAPDIAPPPHVANLEPTAALLQEVQTTFARVAEAHRLFLEGTRSASEALVRILGAAEYALAGEASCTGAAATMPIDRELVGARPTASPLARPAIPRHDFRPASTTVYDYAQCLEFAEGAIGRVFGPSFGDIDRYGVRVRLPSPPLLLCHRVTAVRAEADSMRPGSMDTESDHPADAFFAHRGHIPCGIAVESGQADLMLVSYLGIDHVVRGEKRYRLLDCELTFDDLLPRAGKTLHYHITIDRFVEQAGTHLFFFHYDLTVDGAIVLRMRNGCAGFFSQEALDGSLGMVLPPRHAPTQKRPPRGQVVPALSGKRALADKELTALAQGDLVTALGPEFAIATHQPEPLTIADGPMKLLHRVTRLEPEGGALGLGLIEAETDIHPDDWFFPCHFRDDEVMAGTLMYESCVQMAQIFLLALGHGLEYPDGMFHPLTGETATLKCRGQVLTTSQKITYRLDITERGTEPEPYVVAEANCSVDGKHIVWGQNLTLRIVGARIPVDEQWRLVGAPRSPGPAVAMESAPPICTREELVEFGTGRPSNVWGPAYAIFDTERPMARPPNGPYLFIDRITRAGQPRGELKAGAWVVGEYDVPAEAWYFDRQDSPTMPFAALLEAVLQPCGYLATYAGSDLRSPLARRFRNLGGQAVQYAEVWPASGTLTTRATLTKFSEHADTLVVHYEVTTTLNGQAVLEGSAYFGFFTDQALSNQKGLSGKMPPGLDHLRLPEPIDLRSGATVHPSIGTPRAPLLMLDRVVAFDPAGGRHGLGYLRAEKDVDPSEWFFDAHFCQDPVMPGSLGIEGALQLMQVSMLKTWPEIAGVRFTPLMLGRRWDWTYRGQVLRRNTRITVEVEIVERHDRPVPSVIADAFLMVDGLPIYRLDGVGLQLVAG